MVPGHKFRSGKAFLKMRFVLKPKDIGEDLSRQDKQKCKVLIVATSLVSILQDRKEARSIMSKSDERDGYEVGKSQTLSGNLDLDNEVGFYSECQLLNGFWQGNLGSLAT